MGFSLSVGNYGPNGPQLKKKLLKHFGVTPRDIATAGRQFPITARIDIQSGLESLLKRNPETKLLGLVSPNSHESLTFARMFGVSHFNVDVGPLQYDEIDIGDAVPIRCLKEWFVDRTRKGAALRDHARARWTIRLPGWRGR